VDKNEKSAKTHHFYAISMFIFRTDNVDNMWICVDGIKKNVLAGSYPHQDVTYAHVIHTTFQRLVVRPDPYTASPIQ